HVPAEPLGGPHWMHLESRHAARMGLAAGEQHVALLAEAGEVAEELALVDLAARAGLRRDAAVGRADPHHATPAARAAPASVSAIRARWASVRSGEHET